MVENKRLKGSIKGLTTYYTDAYEIAVKNGFKGTAQEWLEAIYKDAATAVEAYAESAETARNEAEGKRVEAENTRADNELDRQNNEDIRNAGEGIRAYYEELRISAENERIYAENERIGSDIARGTAESERYAAELRRAEAENVRVVAENKRLSAENARADEELTRKNNENYRLSAEQSRDSAESDRVADESTRNANETARINAEKGRVNAETARNNAEALRSSAETLRAEAETARATAEAERIAAEEVRRANFEALPNNIGNAIKGSASGKVVRVDDVSPIEHTVKVKVGRCKNLIPCPYKEGSKTSRGVTFAVNDDGSITINGTAEGETAFTILSDDNISVKGTYTLSGITGGNTTTYYMQAYVNNIAQKIVTDGSNSYQWDGVVTRLVIFVKSGCVFNNLIVTPQLEVGDTATEYEPYIDPTTVTVAVQDADGVEISTHTPSADGVCEIASLSPTMTLLTDTEGAIVEIEYNRDGTKAVDEVKADIRELDNRLATLIEEIRTEMLGNIRVALDEIIAKQNSYIEGGA